MTHRESSISKTATKDAARLAASRAGRTVHAAFWVTIAFLTIFVVLF